jgi:hypothetical protein
VVRLDRSFGKRCGTVNAGIRVRASLQAGAHVAGEAREPVEPRQHVRFTSDNGSRQPECLLLEE